MTWKTSTNTGDTGDAAKFGGADINKYSDLFNGVAAIDTVDFNNNVTFRTNILRYRNPGNTFSYIISTSAITADRTITEPLLTGNDTRVYEAHTQTLLNKTLTSPVISTIVNTGTLTLPTATTTITGRDTTDTLSNKTFAATTVDGTVTFNDAKDIAFNTTTGTKIGTATTQKLAFFNATPVVQQAANADTSGATLAALETEVNELKATLRTFGLIAT